MISVILCGGSGTRLWPISRTIMPKQFIKLFNDKSLFQMTLDRNSSIFNKIFVISNFEQYFLALEQANEIGIAPSDYILEPFGKSTAPAIAFACFALNQDDILFIAPSDHLIKNKEEYKSILLKAKELAKNDNLVTFGIKPRFAQTGFGYIELKNLLGDIKAFHEKPDLKTATKYIEAGNYYWNSGMFMFKAGVFLEELKKYSPKIYETSLLAFSNAHRADVLRIRHDDMMKIPENSIDYAVMEKSDRVKMVISDIEWSDVGSFDALYEELDQDKNGNVNGENHILIDSKNNFILGNSRRIATIDVEDLIIVDAKEGLLVSKKGSSQKVKTVVEALKEKKLEFNNVYADGYRPWGKYTILEEASGYKIKRIEVKPGKRLSLQKHIHRNEHWIVISGTATVTVGNETKYLRPNESTYIKMGEIHRLENNGKIPVVLIEVQVGEYTGEDDIMRIEDDFNRNLEL